MLIAPFSRHSFVFWARLTLLGSLVIVLALAREGRSAAAADTVPPNPWGVQILREIGPGEGLTQGKAAGVQWMRYPLNWRRTEISPGVYRWTQLDSDLANAAANGMKVMIYAVANPTWAATTSCGPLKAGYLDDLGAFLTAAASHIQATFPGVVQYWGVYNEPDIADATLDFGGCWGKGHPNSAAGAGGAAYAQMMAVAYPAIKQGMPDVMVTNGGLAYDDWYSPPTSYGRVDKNFLDDFLAAGGGQFIDAFDFHYYPAFARNWNTSDRYGSDIVGKANHLKSKLNASGLDLPVLVSETGMRASAPFPPANERPDRYVTQVFARSMSAQLHPISWFTLVDYPYPADPYYYGLVTSSFQLKQSYHAYKTMTGELDGYDFLRVRRGFPISLEGYEFTKAEQHKLVIWSLSNAVGWSFALAQEGGSVRKVAHTGAVTTLTDGEVTDPDGERDGRITITVGADPIYLSGLATQLGSIGGAVFSDSNDNGLRDTGEPGLGAASLSLFSANGVKVGDRTSSAAGEYEFAELEPGRYRLLALPPPGHSLRTSDQWVTVAGGATTTVDLAAEAYEPPPDNGWQQEAEDALVAAPMSVKEDAQASGGRFVSTSVTSYEPDSTLTGANTFIFNIPSAGNYYLWARVMGLDGRHNSFWLSLDGGADAMIEIQPNGDRWEWVWQRGPVQPYALSVGLHTLRFSGREADARLDKIALSDNPNFDPSFVPTATVTPTPTPTLSATPTATATSTPTPSRTPTRTPTQTATASPTPSATASPEIAVSVTPSPTETPSATPSPTNTPTQTPLASATATPTSTPTTGSLSGCVFVDHNNNYECEPGESRLRGAQIRVFLFDQPDPVSQVATDAQGLFRFDALAPGVYLIHVSPPAGWEVPLAYRFTQVIAGAESPDNNFPAQPLPTVTPTGSSTPTATPGPTATPTLPPTATSTATATATLSPTSMPSVTPSSTATTVPSATATTTPTVTHTPSRNPSRTPSPTPTSSPVPDRHRLFFPRLQDS